jgi:hypothetical protein
MRWAFTGLTVLAAAQMNTAYANARNADLWIGFSDNLSGFLLDEDNGDVWMTGPCLKPLEPAVRSGSVWTSHTIELVSIGRGLATLDQRFDLNVSNVSSSITVVSNGRGGVQNFAANVDRDCQTDGVCASLIATQSLCQD